MTAEILEAERARLDILDEVLFGMISQRVALSGEIQALKAKQGLPERDEGRERAILKRAEDSSQKHGKRIRAVMAQILVVSNPRWSP